MAFNYPYGDTQQLNLNWFLAQWETFREQWATAEEGIDHALDAEIARVEAAMTDLYAARDAAAASKTAAQTAATNAASSATVATQQATLAQSYANTAQTQAGIATAAAEAAGNSASSASTSATAANLSKTQAANSATAAQTAQTAAEAAETNIVSIITDAIQDAADAAAATATADAEAAADAAEASATAAAGSASDASDSATAAAGSASDAADSATAAAGSATAAAGSATAAAGSASDAADSATAAAASAASIVVDSAMSDSSTNPVQNKVINGEITKLKTATNTKFAPTEASTTVTRAYGAGDYLIYDNELLVTVNALEVGDTIVKGTNCRVAEIATDLENELKAISEDLNYQTNFVNYGYDYPIAIVGNDSATDSTAIHLKRYRELLYVHNNTTISSAIMIRLSNAIQRTINTSTVRNWSNGIVMKAGHTYRITLKRLSGTCQINGVDSTCGVSMYIQGQSSTVGEQFYNNNLFIRTVTFTADSTVNIALVIPANTKLTNVKYLVLMEDIETEAKDLYSTTAPVFGAKKLGYITSKMWGYKTAKMQGIAINNGVLFQAIADSSSTHDEIKAYNLINGTLLGDFVAEIGHGNTINFGTKKYDAGDTYPLLYGSAITENNNRYISEVRIQYSNDTFTATTIRKFLIPSECGYYTQAAVDDVTGIFVAQGYKENEWEVDSGTNRLIISVLDMFNAVYDSETGIYTPPVLKKFEIPFAPYVQGCKIFAGKFWLCYSKPSTNNTTINIVDFGNGTLQAQMTDFIADIKNYELEGIEFVEEPNGKYSAVLAVQGKAIYKVVFSD